MKTFLFALSASLISVGSMAGGAVDFSLSNDSVRAEHDAVFVGSGAHFTVGGLYNEENSNWALTGGFNAVDATLANEELIGGVGFKAFMLRTEIDDLSLAAGVGGFLRWQPDFMNGLGLEGHAYYAPSILSFGDAKSVYDITLRATYKVLPQARVFVGFHEVAADYEDGPLTEVDSTFHIGLRVTY